MTPRRPTFILPFILLAASAIAIVSAQAEVPRTDRRMAQTGNPARPASASARPSPAKPPTRQPGDEARPTTATGKISEAESLAFAREHHPELAQLLDTLRGMDRRHFDDALRDLSRDVERLMRMRDREPDRYPLSLELWKLESRIRLEVARYSTTGNDDFQVRLKPLIDQRREARVKLLQLDRSKAVERLKRIDEQLATLRSESDKQTAHEINLLRKSVSSKARPGTSPTRKPAAAPVKTGTTSPSQTAP